MTAVGAFGALVAYNRETKNQKAKLTKTERNDLKDLVPLLVKTHAKGRRL